MEIPNKIKVGGHDVKVETNVKFDSPQSAGYSNLSEAIIRISEGMSPDSVAQTFLHEILHLVERVYCPTKVKEEVIEQLSEGLYQVLKDNRLKFWDSVVPHGKGHTIAEGRTCTMR